MNKKELLNAMKNSPLWKAATKAMNNMVNEANAEGRKMTRKERATKKIE